MKRAMILVVVLMLAGSMAYAADGDLIVNGKVGIGTTTPQTKLDVAGDISFVKDGKRFVLQYMNLGEDVYGGGTSGGSDTCNGHINDRYSCTASENRQCIDSSYDCDNFGFCQYVGRYVTCKAVLFFVVQ